MDYNRVYQSILLKATNRADKREFEDFRCPQTDILYRLKTKEHRIVHRLLVKSDPDNVVLLRAYIDYLHTIVTDTRLRWVTNGEVDRRIVWGSPLPRGYQYGRKKRLNRLKAERQAKLDAEQAKIEYWTEQYDIYRVNGWEIYCMETGYTKTQQNLVQMFRRYVPHFLPQNGKQRKGWIHR